MSVYVITVSEGHLYPQAHSRGCRSKPILSFPDLSKHAALERYPGHTIALKLLWGYGTTYQLTASAI